MKSVDYNYLLTEEDKLRTVFVKKKGRISELHLGLAAALGKMPSHPIDEALLFLKLLKRGKIR